MNQSHKIAMVLATFTTVAISSEALAIKMPHKYDPGNQCTTAKFLGKKIAEGCYRVYEDVHSNHRNHFTINTDIGAEAFIFNSARQRVQFIANGWEKGPAGRATRAWFKVNGKTVANIYQRKYGNQSAGSVYTTPFIKKIGGGKLSVGVGPVSVTVGAKIEANVKPGMQVHAQNPNPASTRNGWVRVIHRDSIKLTATASGGGSALGFGLGAKGTLKLVDLNTGLVSPKDTKLLLKRTTAGNTYYNHTHLNGCLLGGKIDVWAKAFWKKYSKTLVNRKGTCFHRQLVNINEMIEYPNPSGLLFTPVKTTFNPVTVL